MAKQIMVPRQIAAALDIEASKIILDMVLNKEATPSSCFKE